MAQADNWREKYLSALDEQERLENLNSAQAELLRRVVVNLSAAAAGLDTELDSVMATLKDKIRGATGSAVHDQVVKLEHAVRRFVDQREEGAEDVVGSLQGLLGQLRNLSVGDALDSSLNLAQKRLPQATLSMASLPSHLKELMNLQQQALQQSMLPPQGLWQRLRGGIQLQSGKSGQQEDSTLLEAELDDPEWESICGALIEGFKALLSQFSNEEKQSECWQRANARLESGLARDQLEETLRDIGDLIAGRDEIKNNAISHYLSQVHHELHEICEQLGLGVDEQKRRDEAAHMLGQAVANRMAHIHSSLDNGEDIELLKTDIRQQISQIQQALDAFHQQQQQSVPLSDELQRLIEKVHSMESEAEKTRVLLAEQSYKANHDALTELPNREAYNQRVQQEWQRFCRYGRELSLAVVDVDHFKSLNDQYGHSVGDKVLRIVAQSIRQRLRNVDFVARYGGEEFVVLMPETGVDDAYELMDRMRKAIAKVALRFKSQPITVTFSCGLAAFGDGDSVETVFQRADKALYEAKRAGRNRVLRESEIG